MNALGWRVNELVVSGHKVNRTSADGYASPRKYIQLKYFRFVVSPTYVPIWIAQIPVPVPRSRILCGLVPIGAK
jgi:hypothetical protein